MSQLVNGRHTKLTVNLVSAGYSHQGKRETARVQHYNPLHDATLTSTQAGSTAASIQQQTGEYSAPPASSHVQGPAETSRTDKSTLGPLSTLGDNAINGMRQQCLIACFFMVRSECTARCYVPRCCTRSQSCVLQVNTLARHRKWLITTTRCIKIQHRVQQKVLHCLNQVGRAQMLQSPS